MIKIRKIITALIVLTIFLALECTVVVMAGQKDVVWRVNVKNQYDLRLGEKIENLEVFALLSEELSALERLQKLVLSNNKGNLLYEDITTDSLPIFMGAAEIKIAGQRLVLKEGAKIKEKGIDVNGEISVNDTLFRLQKENSQMLRQNEELLKKKKEVVQKYNFAIEKYGKSSKKEQEKITLETDLLAEKMKFLLQNEAANHAYLAGDFQGAIANYNELIAKDPQNINLLKTRAFVFYDAGNYDDAILAFTFLFEKDKQNENYLYYRANAYYYKGNYQKAIEDYTTILAKQEQDGYAFCGRANAYKKMGDYDAAIVDYTAAIVVQPDLLIARANRGDLYMYKQSLDLAMDDYDVVVKNGQGDAQTYLNRGAIFLKKNQPENAIRDFDIAISLKNDYLDAYYNKALAIELILNEKKKNKSSNQSIKETVDWLINAYQMLINKASADNVYTTDAKKRIAELQSALKSQEKEKEQVEVLDI